MKLQEAQKSIIKFLLHRLLRRLPLTASLSTLPSPVRLLVLLLRLILNLPIVNPLAIKKRDLRLLPKVLAVFLHIALLLLHVLMHHFVCESHSSLRVLS